MGFIYSHNRKKLEETTHVSIVQTIENTDD